MVCCTSASLADSLVFCCGCLGCYDSDFDRYSGPLIHLLGNKIISAINPQYASSAGFCFKSTYFHCSGLESSLMVDPITPEGIVAFADQQCEG